MARRKTKIREDWVEVWHLENHEPGSRLWKLTLALAAEDEFNDPYANVAVTNDSTLFCNDMTKVK